MTGRRMEKTGAPKRPEETSSEIGASSPTHDNNVHRWQAGDNTPGSQRGEPSNPQSRNSEALLARRLSGSSEPPPPYEAVDRSSKNVEEDPEALPSMSK